MSNVQSTINEKYVRIWAMYNKQILNNSYKYEQCTIHMYWVIHRTMNNVQNTING